MPKAADTRILQMQFDNKDFERDIKTSEKTLDRFKDALDFSKCEKSLDELSKATKALTFDNVINNIQKLTDKFTGLGTVSELVLSQIRRGIEDTARKLSGLVDSLYIQTIGEGKDKFEQMNKNVQTIMAATGRSESDVYKVMERLNKYTDQTSYNFTDMAANIGKFTSVGIGLERAEKQMEGIANWAARSGAGVAEASRAMYNLSQAMGVGHLLKIDWKSIENAGMATKEFKQELIDAGLAEGTLVIAQDKAGKTVVKTAKKLGKQVEVTYSNLAETLQKKWATQNVIGKTLEGYYRANLDPDAVTKPIVEMTDKQLAAVKEKFDDYTLDESDFKYLQDQGLATDKLKQALIDAAVAQKKLTKAGTKGGKTLYQTTNKTGKKIQFTIDEISKSLGTGWLDRSVGKQAGLLENLADASYKAAQKCTTLKDVFNAWKDQLSTGWMKAWQKIFGGLSESMELFSAICNKVGDGFSKFITMLVGDGDKVKGILGWWEDLGGRDSLWSLFVGEYDDGLYEGAYGILDVIDSIKKMISDAFWDLMYTLNAGTLESKGISREQWLNNEDYRQFFTAARFKEAIDNIKNFIQKIHEYFNSIAPGETETRLQKIQKFINGILSITAIIWNSIEAIFGFFKTLFDQDHLGPAVDDFIAVLEALGLGITDTASKTSKGGGLKKFFDGLLVALNPLIGKDGAINKFIHAISGVLITFFQTGTEGGRFSKLWENICNVFNKLIGIVSKVAGPVFEFVGELLDIVNMFFTDGINEKSLKKAGKMLYGAVEHLFSGILGIFPELGKKFEKFFAYIFGFADEDAAEEADGSGKTILGTIKRWLREIFGGTSDFLQRAKDEFGNVSLFSIIKENLGIGLLGKLIGDFSGIVKGTNLYGLIMSFLGGFALFRLIKTLKKGGGMFSTITTFFRDLKNKSLKDIIGEKLGLSKQMDTATQKLNTIAKSIALIIGAVTVLCLLPVENLKRGIIAFGIIAVLIVALIAILKKMTTNIEQTKSMGKLLNSIGLSILMMSIGLALLVKALKPLGEMNFGQMATMLVGFAGILLILGVFMKSVSKDESGLKIKGTGSLVLVALAIGILIKALQPLGKCNWKELAKMGAALVVIMGVLSIFTQDSQSMKGTSMKSLILVAASVWVLIQALIPLAKCNWEELGKMGVALIVIMSVITDFTKSVSGVKMKGMGSLALVVGSIWLLLEALKPLAKFKWQELAKMGVALVVIMGVLSIFTQDSQSMKGTGMWQMVLVAGALWVLVQTLMPLAKYNWEELAKMGVGLVLMSTIVVLMTRLAGDMGLLKGAGVAVMMLGLAVVLLAFGFAMSALKDVKWENIAVACVGFIAILVVFALIAKQMMLMKGKDVAKMLPMFVMLLGLAVVMVAFSLALNEVKKVDSKKILAFAVGLSAILIAFSVALNIVRKVPIGGAIKGILVLAVGIAAIMGVIALIAPLVIGSIGGALESLATKLNTIGALIQSFTGRMDNVDENGISKGENVLHRIKDMMVFISGFIGMNLDIDSFATALFELGTGFENFSWHMNRTDFSSAGDSIKMIKDLAACANDLDTITKLNISDMTTKITGLGGAMMLYARGAKEVASEGGIEFTEEDIPDVTAAVALMKAITEGLADSNGIVIPQNMPGTDELGEFGAQLAALAGAIVMFEDAGSSIGEGTRKALDVIDYFKDLKDRLDTTSFVNNYNEITGTFTKEKVDVNVLSEFGKNIEDLGSALANFAHNTTTVDEATGEVKPINFDSALETLDSFVKLKEKLPETGGLLQFFTGTKQSLTELGGEIDAFGISLNGLNESLIGTDANGNPKFDPSSTKLVSGAVDDIIAMLTALNDGLPGMGAYAQQVGGLKALFTGRPKQLNELGSEVSAFGLSLHELSMSVTGKDPETGKKNYNPQSTKIVGAALDDVLKMLTLYSEQLPIIGDVTTHIPGWKDLFRDRPKTLGELGTDLLEFGEKLCELSKAITGKDKKGNKKFDPVSVDTVKKAAEDTLSIARTFGQSLPMMGRYGLKVGKLKSVFEDQPKTLGDLGAELVDFSGALASLSDNIIGKDEQGNVKFDPSVLPIVQTAVGGMVDMITYLNASLPNVGGLAEVLSTVWEGKHITLTDLGKQMGDMSAGLKIFGENVKAGHWDENIGAGDALAAVDYLVQIMTHLSELNTYMPEATSLALSLTGYVSMFGTTMDKLGMAGDNIDKNDTISSLIVKMMSDISEAFNKYGDIDSGRIAMFKSMAEAIYYLSNVNKQADWEGVGTSIADGVKVGINKGSAGVVNAAVDMAVAAYTAAKKALDSHSPSKVFAELGNFAADGLAIGMERGTGKVENAGEGMVEDLITSAKSPLEVLRSLLTDEIDMNPVITPILDLTNVTSGAQAMNEYFNNPYGLSLNGGSISLDPSRATIYANTSLPKDYSESINGIRSEVSDLRTDIQQMSEAMRQMKFVFNSGAVVAAIGPEMDEYLGRQGYYAVRGEIP